MLDEAERSLHDALCVLSQTVQDARVVYGGGFPEMQMAKASALLSGYPFMVLMIPCCAHTLHSSPAQPVRKECYGWRAA